MITSAENRQIKEIAALIKKSGVRNEKGLFVAEGRKMFAETPKGLLKKVYIAESFLTEEENRKLLQNVDYEVVADRIFSGVSDTVTPQGILCLVKKPVYRFEELLKKPKAQLLILESIQDPGNLGTMIRTGEGAGMAGVIMNRTTADLFSPKVIRSTMGSIYRVPYYISKDLGETIGILKKTGITVYAAHLDGSVLYDEPDYTKCGTAFLIGNEGRGLSPEMEGLADACIKIPMEGGVESLNAGVSAAILMYEAMRQKRRANEDLV